jgi:hypothetical protein
MKNRWLTMWILSTLVFWTIALLFVAIWGLGRTLVFLLGVIAGVGLDTLLRHYLEDQERPS